MEVANVEEFLEENQIDYVLHEHPPVYTTAEAALHTSQIPGQDCKNLLLKDQKSRRFFLLILPASLQADIAEFSQKVGEKKLSFANSRNLKELLGVEPGAVSPFGLLNDPIKRIEVYIHTQVFEASVVKFHPNRNTATLEISNSGFKRFLALTSHKINLVN